MWQFASEHTVAFVFLSFVLIVAVHQTVVNLLLFLLTDKER